MRAFALCGLQELCVLVVFVVWGVALTVCLVSCGFNALGGVLVRYIDVGLMTCILFGGFMRVEFLIWVSRF